NYIDKMSDYCQNCHYNKKTKYGERACPFNSLYWDFYDRHADQLERNPRIGVMYRTWAKLPPDERARILAQAAVYRAQADAL
ncbi:MAG TPA: cryptochrome/photolyase family protein, partial [Saprospiraceae bacterium]|nr:cryptochrome/photolyase family protein [Saprospiraceae bacterium]